MAATTEQYYFAQGRCFGREPGGKWVWWGDMPELSFGASVETVRRRESYSGKKGTVARFDFLDQVSFKAKVGQVDGGTLARFAGGTVTTTPAGSVTGETLGTVEAGDVIMLAHGGVSSLVITDSNSTPATIAAANYELSSAAHGRLLFKTLPSAPAPTPPLRAAYSHTGDEQVALFNRLVPSMEFRFEGINLANGGKPVIFEAYKLSTSFLQTFPLITSGTDTLDLDVEGEMLLDSSKPAGGALGQFGRFVMVNPLA
ncbi:MAG: hypothetical protein QM702_07470 [Rubrivivax sp.]